MRFALLLQYNGGDYHGWQVQQGVSTIQGTLDKCFSDILCSNIHVLGCGRTDAGVNAREYVAYFDYVEMKDEDINFLLWKVNSYLPNDIQILQIVKVKDSFNARFDAISRTYKYYITSSKQPFNSFVWFVPYKLDIEKMNTVSRLLYQYDDFTSFSKLHTQVSNNNCEIYYAHWNKKDNILVFTIKANRFLRNMVRSIVGSIVDVGRGKSTVEEFAKLIESKDRNLAGVSAPAYALFLEKVEYMQRIFRRNIFVD